MKTAGLICFLVISLTSCLETPEAPETDAHELEIIEEPSHELQSCYPRYETGTFFVFPDGVCYKCTSRFIDVDCSTHYYGCQKCTGVT